MSDDCRCGHQLAAHDHYRAGTECATCPPEACPRFRTPGRVDRLLAAAADLGFAVRLAYGLWRAEGRDPDRELKS